MKKITSILLIALMSVSLVACGSSNGESKQENPEVSESKMEETSEEQITKYNLGDTVSTDIVDFTLDSAVFSYYASALESTYCEPIEQSDGGIFATSKGNTFVCMQFKLVNNDRSSLHVADYGLAWDVLYDGENYPIHTYDLNQKDGSGYLNLRWSLIGSSEDTLSKNDTSNKIMNAGATMVVKTLGQVNMEPTDLSDGFEMIVKLPSSSGDDEEFIFVIEN